MNGFVQRALCLMTCLLSLVVATPASAQFAFTSAINGAVTDESGGALPGVTVTLSGAALQVQQTTITDADGRYRFLELRAGTYDLRFELAGFQTLIRSDLQVATAFAARVDVQLKIGALNESITVSGASPVVDVTTTSGGQTLSQEMVTTLIPTSKFHGDLARLTPGLMNTAPPQTGSLGTEARGSFSAYGSSGLTVMVDGIDVRSNTAQDFGAGQEVDIRTFGNSAEHAAPGAVFNIVTKSGGNELHGSFQEQYISGKLQSTNLDDELKSQGVSSGDAIQFYNDIGGDLGGRIVRDKLWYYGDLRDRRNEITILGLAADPGADGQYGTGDETPFYPKTKILNFNGKLTYQATPKYQFVGYYGGTYQVNDGGNNRGIAHRLVPYENGQYQTYDPSNWRGEMRATLRNDLLFNVQAGRVWYTVDYMATPSDNSNRNLTSRIDRETGIRTGGVMGTGNSEVKKHRVRYVTQASLTYAPSSGFFANHEIKTGYRGYLFQMQHDTRLERPIAGNYILVYDRVSGVAQRPVELWTYNLPVDTTLGTTTNLGAFVTDQWRVGNRLTLNLGVRWDNQSAYVPAQCKEQGQFGNAGCYPRIDAENLTNISPRLAAAYDVSGTGKSVLKTTWGRYVDELDDNFAQIYNQNNLTETRYRWADRDSNNNYTPGEVNLDVNGPDFISISGASNNIFNPDLNAATQTEFTVSFDRELMANTSFRALYAYKREDGTVATVNILRPYSAYNIPLTRRDPGPDGVLNNADDGSPVTIYDYDPAYRGSAFVGNQRVNRPDGDSDSYKTVELTFTRRTSQRWGAMASYAVTKNHRYITGVIQSPNDEPFNLDETWNWVFKTMGNYRLPADVMLSGVFDVISGTPGQRTNIFRSADPDGGTPLRQLSTVTLRMEPFGSQRSDMKVGMNFRASKFFDIGKGNLQLAFDLFNALNSNAVWAADYQSGPTFSYANTITKPRSVQLVAQYRF